MNFFNFSLNEWLHYLENMHPQEMQLGLARVDTVAKSLDILHWDAHVITVAGTNGKGSTVASLEAIYTAAGYNIASYTSPHLMTFNERIRINQQPISDENLCAAFGVIEEVRSDIPLTYFEMATLAALWYFKQYKLDLIILEVGMGGRLDATNIIDADLAIITTIDFDHQDFLGDTKEAIGYEKAGILRANIPFIYADYDPPESIVEQARGLDAQMCCLGAGYSFKTTEDALQIVPPTAETIHLPLPKINPKAAAAATIASLFLNPVLAVTLNQMAIAMRTVSISGRQQVVLDTITTVFDVAHNPQAVSLLADFIQKYKSKAKVHAVFSGLQDKDLCGLIKPMRSCVDFWYPAILSGKRAANESLLTAAFLAENCTITACFKDPLEAYNAAKQDAKQGDLIVVYGSFLTVSAIMVANRRIQEEVQ